MLEQEEQQQPALQLAGFRDPFSEQIMLMTEQEAPVYEKFIAAYLADFKAVGQIEKQLAHSIAISQWRMNYVRALQNNMLSLQLAMEAKIEVAEPNANTAAIAAQTQPRKAFTLRELSLYEQRLNRQFHQDLKVLRDIQKERKAEEKENLQQAAQILKVEIAKTPKGETCKYHPRDDGYELPLEVVARELHIQDRRQQAKLLEKGYKAAA